MCEFESFYILTKNNLKETQESLENYIKANPEESGIKDAKKILELTKESGYKAFSVLHAFGKGHERLQNISVSFELPSLVESLIDAYITYANLFNFITLEKDEKCREILWRKKGETNDN